MPDIFRGDPAPHDIYFDADEFLAKHTTNVTDPVIETTIRYMRDTLSFDRIAVTGYCFGGRYAFRFLQEGRGADIGFAAHPSFLQDSEVRAIGGPASIAAAGESCKSCSELSLEHQPLCLYSPLSVPERIY